MCGKLVPKICLVKTKNESFVRAIVSGMKMVPNFLFRGSEPNYRPGYN